MRHNLITSITLIDILRRCVYNEMEKNVRYIGKKNDMIYSVGCETYVSQV